MISCFEVETVGQGLADLEYEKDGTTKRLRIKDPLTKGVVLCVDLVAASVTYWVSQKFLPYYTFYY